MRYFGTPLIDGRQLDALRHRNFNVEDSQIRFRDRWTQLDALWTPTANVEWRTRVYQINSQRDWRNAEAYVYNPRTGLVDRSGNTRITHNQDQTGLTSTLRVQGEVGGLANSFAFGPGRAVPSGARPVRQRCAEPAALPQPRRAVRAVRG
ncbi:hypothetical protein G6F32_014809 [Rhizopus arrhizus]|nr:hypothetical protein G6F32_014809 [Rhizopus arrhizus]